MATHISGGSRGCRLECHKWLTWDCSVQIKYFKEKRVMEYNRDATIEKIKKDDAEMAAKAKAERRKAGGGGGGGWFS